jgi:Glycosyltransferase Family 4
VNKKLTILISNNTLDSFAGSESYVLDLCKELLKKGHKPICFSLKLGEVAEVLRRNTIPCIDDLNQLTLTPDIIHGQHGIETMMAVCHFYDTPAVNMCHGWLPWQEIPICHPRILRYIAVDALCKERLTLEYGIGEEQIDIIPNFLHVENYPLRGPLPDKIKKAAVFSNYADFNNTVVIRKVCEEYGITLDLLGENSGQPIEDVAPKLANYDLVFAKGRCAMEALIVGSSVVIMHQDRLAGMVTSDRIQHFKPLNFGTRTMLKQLNELNLKDEITLYKPQNAREVSNAMRTCLNADKTVDKLIDCYCRVLEEFKHTKYTRESEASALMTSYKRFKFIQENNIELTRKLAKFKGLHLKPQISNQDIDELENIAQQLQSINLELASNIMKLTQKIRPKSPLIMVEEKEYRELLQQKNKEPKPLFQRIIIGLRSHFSFN